MRRPLAVATLAASLLVLPRLAEAHLVTSGLGPYYDGALHLLMSPSDLLGLIAVALLAGRQGAGAGRLTVFTLSVAWWIAGLVGLGLPNIPDLAAVGTVSFLIMGLLVAADVKLPPVGIAAIAAAYGLLHGLMNGTALAAAGAELSTLNGIVLAVLCLAVLTASAVVPLTAPWARVAVRVAGSWIAAVGMLMIGWTLQGAV
jgi:hydrogenase/urease accessory protein HupE